MDTNEEIWTLCEQCMELDESRFGNFARGALAAGALALGANSAKAANVDIPRDYDQQMQRTVPGRRTGILFTMPDGSKVDKGFLTQDQIDAYHARHGGVGEMSQRHNQKFDTNAGTVVTDGYGENEETAIKNAIRSAIEKANGSMINAETTVQNDELVKDFIRSSSRGNVEKYKVLSSSPTKDGLVRVKVQVNLGNNMNAELGDGEIRGGSYAAQTEVNNDELTKDSVTKI